MDRDSKAAQALHELRTLIGLGCFAIVAFGAASGLTGCSSTKAGSGCTSVADCASGEQCSNGQCEASSNGSAGASEPGIAGNSAIGTAGSSASGGQNSFAGAAGSGVQNASGGAGQSSGGSPGQAGSDSTGNPGSAGNAAGGNPSGSAGNGNAGNGNAGDGSAGMSGGGDVTGQCKDDYWPGASNGSVTRYDFIQGTSLPACAYAITHKGAGKDGDWDTVEGISTGDGGYFGAMNTTDYNQGAACGACAEITYNGGTKIVITIVDECPVSSNNLCVKGHIDLSRKAIRQLQPNSSLEKLGSGGNGSISWRYVTCPAIGDAKIRLHPNETANWQPVVIENGLYPLSSVTINGTNASRTGNNSGGNAWLASGAKLPYTVRATDVNGDTIQTTYNGGSGLQDTGKQFMCKQ